MSASGSGVRRLAAILAIDMVAYSRRMNADEEGTIAALRSVRASIIDPAIATAAGRIFKTTGDGLLCEFSSVVAAVSCALEIQRACAASGPQDDRPQFRIGVSLGDVVADGEDLYGDGVNMAARLEGVAQPGGIAVSAVVRQQVGHRLPVAFVSRGRTALKNIPEPVEVFDVLADSLPVATHRGRRRLLLPIAAAAAAALLLLAGGAAWWRFGSGAAVEVAGSRPGPDSAATAPLVAVLPLANQSGDASQDFFSDGVTEDIIAALGRFRSLAVLSRSAVMPMKGSSPDETARRLGARYVVEGNVRRSGDRVRVQASLTDAQVGQVLWSDRFDGDAKDLFALQDELAQQIAGTIANRVGHVEQERASRRPAMNPTAYELILRGRALANAEDRSKLVRARGYLEQALAIAPTSVEARIGLARVFYNYVQLGFTDSPDEMTSEAEAKLREALRTDPSNAEAYAVLSHILANRERYDDALAAVNKALELNPSDAEAQYARGSVLLWVGRTAEAEKALELGRRLDPYPSVDTVFAIGLANYLLGRFERARSEMAVATESNSRIRGPLFALLAIVEAELGRADEVRAAVAMVRRQDPFFDPDRFGTRLRDPQQRQKVADGLKKAGLVKP